MMSLMIILTFATRLIKDDKLTNGCEKNAFKDKRILVSNDPRWIHRILVAEEATCHSSTECFSA